MEQSATEFREEIAGSKVAVISQDEVVAPGGSSVVGSS